MSAKKSMKQESFDIDLSKTPRIVRQDRFELEANTTYITHLDHKLEVLNINPFGLAVLMKPEDFSTYEALFEVQNSIQWNFVFHNEVVQTLSLQWARLAPNNNDELKNLQIVGLAVTGEPLNTDKILALTKSLDIIENQNNYVRQLGALTPEFKSFVYGMSDWLFQLKKQIDTLEESTPVDNWREAQEYRETIAAKISSYLGHVIPAQYAVIPSLIQDYTPEQKKLATDFARKQIGELVYGAPFANRAYFKPRGYAGDYEMMNHLYRNELVGKTLFDQCMHKYFIDEPAGAAVKNRGHFLFDKITHLVATTPAENPLKFVSIASGPAMEQQLFLKNSSAYHGRDLNFTCIDQDELSLKHAQKQLHSQERFVKSGYKFHFENMAIKNIIVSGLPENNYDLVYSAGLFDYFTAPVAQMAAKKMVEAVKPGGMVIIGNFSKDNPCVPFMEMVLDWHLIYRSEEELLHMFQGLGKKVHVEKEPLGVNLFVIIEK